MNKRAMVAMLLAGVLAPAGAAWAQKAIGEVSASDASIRGSVMVVAGGTRVMSGSSVTAGESTASMRLARGGEVRVCARTSVSLATSANGRDLMLGMGTGAIEAHYTVGNNADSVLTPDFRILLAGPGTFHLAIGSDARGNTCVRTLEGNTSSVIVTEQMGDGVYQVRAHDQVLFRNGSVANPMMAAPPDCGCPPPIQRQQQQAEAPPAPKAATPSPAPQIGKTPEPAPVVPPAVAAAPAASPTLAAPTNPVPVLPVTSGAPSRESLTTPPPPPTPGEVHIQVDAPFVFRASEPVIPPTPTVARVRLQPMPPLLEGAPAAVQPPPPPPPQAAMAEAPAVKPHKKKGLFGKLGSFFAAVFH